jgi:hypothetical protein
MGANGKDAVAMAAAGERPMGVARVITVARLPRMTVALTLWLRGIRGERERERATEERERGMTGGPRKGFF